MKGTVLVQGLALVVCLLMLSVPNVMAQDYCEGNFDYDQDVDGSDAAKLKAHFGRSGFQNPCPTDGPAPVPKTGQTTSYATGDDGNHYWGVASPNPRFTDNGDQTITDNLTGLIWMRNADCFLTRTWNNANSDCNWIGDGVCGLSDDSSEGDWRLPNVRELLSLIDYGNNYPALPSGHPFTNIQTSTYYWTSTTHDYESTKAWEVTLASGRTYQDVKTQYRYTWCVRGGKTVRFTNNGDGTVTDNKTGLVWLKDANCFGYMNWDDAMSTAADLDSETDPCGLTDGSQAGDWRLPTRVEWEAFFCQWTFPAVCNTTGTGPCTEGDPFTNLMWNYYWSTTWTGGDQAWKADAGYGDIILDHMSMHHLVWPVRGGQ